MFAFERQIFKQNCYYSKQYLIYYNLLYKQFGLLRKIQIFSQRLQLIWPDCLLANISLSIDIVDAFCYTNILLIKICINTIFLNIWYE